MSMMMQEIIKILEDGANSVMTLEEIIREEMSLWENSDERKWMITGDQYYRNRTDILDHKRMAIGESGVLYEVQNLANNKLVHGFVRKLVDQKVGYLLSKPFSTQTDNKAYLEALEEFFDKSFMRQLKNVGKESFNKGIAWLQVYYDQEGQLKTKLIPSEQIIPLWSDLAHTELDAVIRVYEVDVYEGKTKKKLKKVEFWSRDGVRRYVENTITSDVAKAGLIPDVEADEEDLGPHFKVVKNGEETGMNWERVPFIPFKYNTIEMPLVQVIKSLADDYEKKLSENSNNIDDTPNHIFELTNYDGTDLGEFRHNLNTYRAVKVQENGGVKPVDIKLDTEALKTHVELLRKNIYEFGRGVDTQSDKFGNSPSGIALRFLYSDLDMDANDIETEFQAALEQLLWFIDVHLMNTTGVDYSGETVDFLLNRDIVINESETITNAKNSVGIISDETIRVNHPWVTDAAEEEKRIKEECKAALEDPLNPFAGATPPAAPEEDEE
ncbi:phage portal protein [Paenibacillus shunpengii]|uniref:Phage portal protein n=1 Tax=Paenibacillus shunpengii TaxID=2054424 RepID=A0ABW5SWG5_9BACL